MAAGSFPRTFEIGVADPLDLNIKLSHRKQQNENELHNISQVPNSKMTVLISKSSVNCQGSVRGYMESLP